MAEDSRQNLSTPESQPPSIRRTTEAHFASYYSGPLPTPSALEGYERIVSGSADRIIRMAEKQAEHRQFLEKTVVVSDAKRADKGLYVGGFVTVCFLGSAAFLIYNGHDWAGGVLAGLDIVGLASVFVYGTISRRAERKKKASTMTQPTENVQPEG